MIKCVDKSAHIKVLKDALRRHVIQLSWRLTNLKLNQFSAYLVFKLKDSITFQFLFLLWVKVYLEFVRRKVTWKKVKNESFFEFVLRVGLDYR